MYRLATKRPKKRVEQNANASFFRQTTKHALVYSTLLTVKNLHRELYSLLLSRLSFCAFVKSNQLNRITRLF